MELASFSQCKVVPRMYFRTKVDWRRAGLNQLSGIWSTLLPTMNEAMVSIRCLWAHERVKFQTIAAWSMIEANTSAIVLTVTNNWTKTCVKWCLKNQILQAGPVHIKCYNRFKIVKPSWKNNLFISLLHMSMLFGKRNPTELTRVIWQPLWGYCNIDY